MLDDLVRRWLDGWAVARGTPWTTRPGPAYEIDPGSPERALEVVLVEPDAVLLEREAGLARERADVWLTLFAAVRAAGPPPDGLVAQRDEEVLMTVDLAPGPVDPRVVLEADGDLATARVVVDGRQVASGVVALAGRDAVVDRVVTSPDHRRQGLGSAVMGALTSWAADRGARRGLLAASSDGRALYLTLGWEVAGAMTTYVSASSSSASAAAPPG